MSKINYRKKIKSKECIYCGDLANTIEHFPPKSCTGHSGFIFNACKECNSFASNEFPLDLEKRIEHVKKKLKCRHSLTLGDKHRDRKKVCSERKLIIQQRLAWNAVEFINRIGKFKSFAQLYAIINGIQENEQD